MGVQCFQEYCLLLTSHYFGLFHFFQCVVVSGRLLCSSGILFSSENKKLFYFILVEKSWVETFGNTKYHLKIHNSHSATLLFIVVIYQAQKFSLFFLFLPRNSHYILFSEPKFPWLSVSAVSSGSLTILAVLYFNVFSSLFFC